MEDMISNDDESVNMSESEMSVETVERPRKRVKLEELPTFIQKFTSTYFKFTKNKPERKIKLNAKDNLLKAKKQDKLSRTMCIDVSSRNQYISSNQIHSVLYERKKDM